MVCESFHGYLNSTKPEGPKAKDLAVWVWMQFCFYLLVGGSPFPGAETNHTSVRAFRWQGCPPRSRCGDHQVPLPTPREEEDSNSALGGLLTSHFINVDLSLEFLLCLGREKGGDGSHNWFSPLHFSFYTLVSG